MPTCSLHMDWQHQFIAGIESSFSVGRLQLRLNKVSELIHNSTYHQNLPMAKVSVHFVDIIDKVRPTSNLIAFLRAARPLTKPACCAGAESRKWAPHSEHL